MGRFARIAIASSLVAALAAGCGGEHKSATQVAAKVNGDEISVHQVNNALARLGGSIRPEQAQQAGGQILERLIDQQLLIQKATAAKLDRDATIMTAIENARRQILSQAYLERTVAGVEKPTAEEIQRFYQEHPELFARRRLYRFQELLATVDAEQSAALQQEVTKDKNMNDLAVWLKSRNVPFAANFSLQGAEQLPAGMLPRLQQMKPGEIMQFPAPGRVLVVQLVAAQEVPISEKDAGPQIERFLVGRKRSESASSEMKKLRDEAKVEYVGDYARLAEAKPAPAAKDPTKDAAGSPAAKEAAPDIDKALGGLK